MGFIVGNMEQVEEGDMNAREAAEYCGWSLQRLYENRVKHGFPMYHNPNKPFNMTEKECDSLLNMAYEPYIEVACCGQWSLVRESGQAVCKVCGCDVIAQGTTKGE